MKKRFKVVAVKKGKEGYAKGDLTKDVFDTWFILGASSLSSDDSQTWQAYDLIFVDALGKIHFGAVGTPPIPDTFKRTWVDRQGQIECVEVEYENIKLNHASGLKPSGHELMDLGIMQNYQPKLINNSIVVTVVENQTNQPAEQPSEVIMTPKQWVDKVENGLLLNTYDGMIRYAEYYHAMLSRPKSAVMSAEEWCKQDKDRMSKAAFNSFAAMDEFASYKLQAAQVDWDKIEQEWLESHNPYDKEHAVAFNFFRSRLSIIPEKEAVYKEAYGSGYNDGRQDSADMLIQISEKEACEFAEWIAQSKIVYFFNNTWKRAEYAESLTTAQLYNIFKEKK